MSLGGVRMEMESNIKIMNIEKEIENTRRMQKSHRTDKYSGKS
jgi:hypothetical protein